MKVPLRDDETVVLETRPHWASLGRAAVTAAAAIAAAALAGFAWSPYRGDDKVDLAASLVAALFVGRFLLALLRRRATHVVVTDRRIVTSSGIGGRSVTSVPLARLGGVAVRRGMGGRLLGYGTIVLTPLWGEGESRLERMPRPRRMQRQIADLLIHRDGPPAPPAASVAEDEDTGPLPRVIV